VKRARVLSLRRASLLARVFHTVEIAGYALAIGPILFGAARMSYESLVNGYTSFSYFRSLVLQAYGTGWPYFLAFGIIVGIAAAFFAMRNRLVPVTAIAVVVIGHHLWAVLNLISLGFAPAFEFVPLPIAGAAILAAAVWWSLMLRFKIV
jgi:hypothetical protein